MIFPYYDICLYKFGNLLSFWFLSIGNLPKNDWLFIVSFTLLHDCVIKSVFDSIYMHAIVLYYFSVYSPERHSLFYRIVSFTIYFQTVALRPLIITPPNDLNLYFQFVGQHTHFTQFIALLLHNNSTQFNLV